MAAVMTTPRFEMEPAVTRTVRRVPPRSVARRGRRTSAATFWRRRVVAVAVGLAVLVVAGKAGAALGGSPLAVPERRPATTPYVVQPGDSLWSIAARLEPGRDPRPLVDALSASRDGAPLVPGEVITRPR
jgi:nucleoid-associated protein YgaU